MILILMMTMMIVCLRMSMQPRSPDSFYFVLFACDDHGDDDSNTRLVFVFAFHLIDDDHNDNDDDDDYDDDFRRYTSSLDASIRRWDVYTMSCTNDALTSRGPVQAMSLAHERLCSGHHDGTVCLWDAENLQCLAVLSGHSAPITSLALDSDARMLLSGDESGLLSSWVLACPNKSSSQFQADREKVTWCKTSSVRHTCKHQNTLVHTPPFCIFPSLPSCLPASLSLSPILLSPHSYPCSSSPLPPLLSLSLTTQVCPHVSCITSIVMDRIGRAVVASRGDVGGCRVSVWAQADALRCGGGGCLKHACNLSHLVAAPHLSQVCVRACACACACDCASILSVSCGYTDVGCLIHTCIPTRTQSLAMHSNGSLLCASSGGDLSVLNLSLWDSDR